MSELYSKCIFCGNKISNNSDVCDKCGSTVEMSKNDQRNEIQKLCNILDDYITSQNCSQTQINVIKKQCIIDPSVHHYIQAAQRKKILYGNDLINVYSIIKKTLNEIIELQNLLAKQNNDYENAIKKEEKIRNGDGGTFRYLVAIILFIIITIVDYWVFALLIAFIGFKIVGFFSKVKHDDEFNLEADKYHEETVIRIMKEIEDTQTQLDECWESDEIKLYELTVPEKYQSMDAIEFFLELLNTKRADSEKDLFNLYEEELHRRKTLELQQQQIEYSQNIMAKQDEHTSLLKEQLNMSKEQLNLSKQQLNATQKISRQVKYGNAVSTATYSKVQNIQQNIQKNKQ